MRYMLLICDDEANAPAPGAPGFNEMLDGYRVFGEELARRGADTGDRAALQPVATATSVRVRNGERLVTDGPFAETKEQLGGYYVVDVPDLDAALELAALIPGAHTGTVEVRPVMEFDEPS